MLHKGAGVETLSYTDIGMNNLCYISGWGYKPYLTLISRREHLMLHIGAGV